MIKLSAIQERILDVDAPLVQVRDEDQPARAVRRHGKLFIAAPLPGDGEVRDAMFTVVLDEVDVIDLDEIPMDVPPTAEHSPSRVVPEAEDAPADGPTGGLTPGQDQALSFIRRIGEKECFDRLYLFGVYGLIHDVIRRMGTDAVGELQRMLEDGRIAASGEAIPR